MLSCLRHLVKGGTRDGRVASEKHMCKGALGEGKNVSETVASCEDTCGVWLRGGMCLTFVWKGRADGYSFYAYIRDDWGGGMGGTLTPEIIVKGSVNPAKR